MFHITRTEYDLMPARVMTVLRICQNVKREIARKEAEKAARGRQQS